MICSILCLVAFFGTLLVYPIYELAEFLDGVKIGSRKVHRSAATRSPRAGSPVQRNPGWPPRFEADSASKTT